MPKTTSELFNDINSPTPYNTSTFSENNNMNETEKFTIRVNFKPQQATLTQDEKTTQYQWGRIIGCSLLVIVGIGGSIYYLSQGNVDDKKITTSLVQHTDSGTTNNTTAITTPVNQTPKPESTTTTTTENSIVSTPVDNANADQQQDQTQATNENRQDNNNINVTKIDPEKRNIEKVISAKVENQSVKDETTITDVESNQTTSAMTTINETDETKASVTADGETAALTTSEEELNQASSTTETNMASPLFSQVNTEILSDNVDRFLITPSVINNEPVGNINDIVFDNNIATVYAYSDVNDLKNSMLYYVWTLNAKDVAKVRVGVIGKRWRSHSSKFVQKNMRGQWKVELQNDKGEILAISQFKY